jgi:hypothetical protein
MLQCCTPRNCKGSLYSQVWSMVPHHTLCSTAVLLYAPQTCASWERFVAESLRRVRCRGRDPPRRPSVARVRPFILSLCCKVKNNNENPITALRCKRTRLTHKRGSLTFLDRATQETWRSKAVSWAHCCGWHEAHVFLFFVHHWWRLYPVITDGPPA